MGVYKQEPSKMASNAHAGQSYEILKGNTVSGEVRKQGAVILLKSVQVSWW